MNLQLLIKEFTLKNYFLFTANDSSFVLVFNLPLCVPNHMSIIVFFILIIMNVEVTQKCLFSRITLLFTANNSISVLLFNLPF